MTVRTVKTNMEEAAKILNDKVRYIFRSDKDSIKEGDIIQFLCIKNMKPALHEINNKSFVVTDVRDCMNAPIDKGVQIIGFRRLS